MDKCGSQWVEIVGAKDKCQIIAVFCGTLVGDSPYSVDLQRENIPMPPTLQISSLVACYTSLVIIITAN